MPNTITLDAADFCEAFPFHVAFSRDLSILQWGPSLERVCPSIRVGQPFFAFFTITRPPGPFDFDTLRTSGKSLFLIEERIRKTLLRGQMKYLASQDIIVFLGSPWLLEPSAIEESGLTFEHFAIHDPALDFLQVVQSQRLAKADLRRLANRLMTKSEALRETNAQLASAIQSRDEFLATMSHELRTPLTGILGLTELLIEKIPGPLNAQQERHLNTVQESGHHLLELINDVLDMAKMEAQQMVLEIQPCNVEDLCQAVLRLLSQHARRKKQHLDYAPAPNDLTVLADPLRLKQALVNLLGNAVKFTPEGGSIGLQISQAANSVLFRVWDHGIGIPTEKHAQLFKPFVQLDSRLARHYGGTGLGLALVKKIATLHKGSIEIESEPGKGSAFTLTLPGLSHAAHSKPALSTTPPVPSVTPLVPNPATVPTPTPGTPGEPRIILLADDSPVTSIAVQSFLTSKGYRVITVRDGQEAIDAADTHRPDLILMDVQMPVIDGLEATRRIRARPDPDVACIPIIALTALALPGDRELCLEAGASSYLCKPVSLAQIHATVLQHLTPESPSI